MKMVLVVMVLGKEHGVMDAVNGGRGRDGDEVVEGTEE